MVRRVGSRARRAIAIDLGGTRFRVAVAGLDGNIEWRVSRSTEPERGRQAVMDDIFDAVDEALAAARGGPIAGIGVGAPGPLDPWTGVIYNPPNLPGWKDVPLRRLLEERFPPLPVRVGNDANLAALGEHRYGAGRGIPHMVYVTVSTGIGGGVIVENRLLLGYCGFAGEVGHMTIDMHGPVCNCGNVGCLEVLASGTALARRAREFVRSGASTTLSGVGLEEITAQVVAEAAAQGDGLARQLLHDAGVALGVGMVNLAHLFNPRRVILGGGVSNAGALLWNPMLETLRTRGMTACHREMEVVPAGLGDDAGLLGAVALLSSE